MKDPNASIGAGNNTTLTGTVAYQDTAPGSPATNGQITLTVAVPQGWTATIEPASAFNLAPGANAPFTVTLKAPAANTGAATGALTVSGTATSGGGRGATATGTTQLTRVDPPPPPPTPWYKTPLGITGIVLAILLVIGVIAAVGISRRNKRLAAERAAAEAAAKAAYLARETGITIALAGEPLHYGHKREVVHRVAVTNTSDRPRVAIVDVAEVTNGWRAALQITKVPLSVNETQQVTLVVTPDAVITPGDKATVIVRAKPEEARELSEKLTLEIVAPKHGVPNDPHYRIVTVHREGLGTKPR